jgi:uncharacterized delta-60 repeat protein
VIKAASEFGVKMRRLLLLSLLISLFFIPGRLAAVDVIEEWVVRYNGPENSDDYAKAMAVDASGNVYVTGHSRSSSSHYDYATTKYDSDGIEQWVARYNGPGNYLDTPKAVAVDAFGNVYVTGCSYGDGTSSDYATIKYNSDGVEQWVARYNGPGNGNDVVYAMALDDLGNVYVTGESDDNDSRLNYTTIKYNKDGRLLWISTYNGPGNYNDSARAIALDALGNVYVTGYSYGGAETREDYATVKYDSSGRELWVARYAGPSDPPHSAYDLASAITVDASGSVYITGYSDGADSSYDYATIKYSSDGIKQWEARYNGLGDNYDYASAITVDRSGNVYVTGYSDNLWTCQDYATVKYDSDGRRLWVAIYNGGANDNDRASSIAVDLSGNVYVTGYSHDGGTSLDYATIMYNSDGDEIWVATYDGKANSDSQVDGTASDTSDNELMTPGDGGPENDCDYAYAMALDRLGNIYVTGGSFGNGTRYDYATIKYSQEDTPPGNRVEVVDRTTGTTLTFDTVVEGGNTTVSVTADGPLTPKELKLVPSDMVYEMSTTALFSGMIQLSIRYDDTGLTNAQENAIKLRCYEPATSEWVDITESRDVDNNIIYGRARHLSFFAVTVTP